MRNSIRYLIRCMTGLVLALGSCSLAVAPASAQGAPVVELGADYNYVRANAPPDGCGCFSMHGANAWFGFQIAHAKHVELKQLNKFQPARKEVQAMLITLDLNEGT